MASTEKTYYRVEAVYMLAHGIVPVYPIFLLSRGLSLVEINLVLATYFIVVFLFEVPTGAVADLFGRKVSVLLACAIRCGAFLLYFFADGFVDCVIAEFFDAIGTTLVSGALSAWAVDGMRAEGAHTPMDRVFARAQMIARGCGIASGILFGYVGDVDIAWPWLLGAASFAAAGVLAASTMHETPPAERPTWRDVHRSLLRTMREGAEAARAAPVVRTICVLSALGAMAWWPVNLLWPPHLERLAGQGTWILGWAWAFLNLAAIAGTALVSRVAGHVTRERVLVATYLARAAAMAVLAQQTRFGPALGALLVAEMAMWGGIPTIEAWLNEHTESARRATVLSVWGMSMTLGGALGCLWQGAVASAYSIPTAWLIGAALLAAIAPGYLLLLGKAGAKQPATARET